METQIASRKILVLGCGRRGRDIPIDVTDTDEVITLDQHSYLEPDIICDLGNNDIPLDDDSIDIVVAVHVLEHIGKQGDTDGWFYFWQELYRVMKPEGQLIFESPMYNSVWAWADPSHVRALSPECFIYLNQDSYRLEDSGISPFRIDCDFRLVRVEGIKDSNPEIAQREKISHFRGVLVAVKPLKPYWDDEDGDKDSN